MTRGLRDCWDVGEGGAGGYLEGFDNLNALHHSGIQGLALVPLKAVALQPGVLQSLLG